MRYKLVYDKKSVDPYYYIQYSVRVGDKVKTHTHLKLGKHSELLKEHTNPLAYAISILDSLNNEINNNVLFHNQVIDFNETLPESNKVCPTKTYKNAGYLYLHKIYHDMKIKDFWDNIQNSHKCTYNFDEINRFLTYGRILEPKSKLGTFDRLDTYLEEPNMQYQHIERFLPIMSKYYNEYITHLFEGSNKIVERDTSVCYYDCTNFFFEIEKPDDDCIDPESGKLIQGFRKYGFNKQHQPLPQVQMGLFMDGKGIPISMTIDRGNISEGETVIPLENKMIKMFKNKQFIYCADAGLGDKDIRVANSIGGKAFIITQSLKKTSNEFKNKIFTDDYKRLSNGEKVTISELINENIEKTEDNKEYDDIAYKIINASSMVELGLEEIKYLKNGKQKKIKSKAELDQIVIVTFSKKSMLYQKNIRNIQIERAKKLLTSPNPENIKKGNNDIRRFIKNKNNNTEYILDNDRISEEEKYDGYYGIATNLDMDDNESEIEFVKRILKINSRRYKIEECFRIMKSNFGSRPVYHHLPETITAHFMICFTALLIYRLLEVKLEENKFHFTVEEIIETLKNINLENKNDLFLEAKYTSGDLLSALESIYPLGLNKKNIELKKFKKMIKNLNS